MANTAITMMTIQSQVGTGSFRWEQCRLYDEPTRFATCAPTWARLALGRAPVSRRILEMLTPQQRDIAAAQLDR